MGIPPLQHPRRHAGRRLRGDAPGALAALRARQRGGRQDPGPGADRRRQGPGVRRQGGHGRAGHERHRGSRDRQGPRTQARARGADHRIRAPHAAAPALASRPAPDPGDPRRSASVRRRRAPGAARQGAHALDAERDSRHRRQAPPGADRALRRPARRAGGGHRRHRESRGDQPAARRAHLPAPARNGEPVMPLNVPNLLTLSRIILIPLIIAIFYVPDDWLSFSGKKMTATAIFIFAAVTDWLDGYLARRLNQMSAFGAFLDPGADNLIVFVALLVLLKEGRVDAVIALIIIGREIAISALREWMAKVGQAKSVAVAFIGKRSEERRVGKECRSRWSPYH